MANFEAFCWNFSSSTNLKIVRSGLVVTKSVMYRECTNFDVDFTKQNNEFFVNLLFKMSFIFLVYKSSMNSSRTLFCFIYG